MTWRDGYIAVDWGTTNRRAYLIDSAGRLADEFADDLGLMAVPKGGFDAAALSSSPGEHGGFGLAVIRSLVDEVALESTAGGTRLRMLRRAASV